MSQIFWGAKNNWCVRALRSLSRRSIVALCVMMNVVVCAPAVYWLLFPGFLELREMRRMQVQRELQAQRWATLTSELHAVTRQLAQARGEDPDRQNGTFQHLHALIEQTGARLRSFEQVGRSSEGSQSLGFTRIYVDTNFLQFELLVDALANSTGGVLIEDFSIRALEPTSDSISVSLAISIVSPPVHHGPGCQL